MNEEEFQEQVEYIRHTLNDMKIKNEDKFLNAVAILYYEYIIQNKEYKRSKLNSNDYIAKKEIRNIFDVKIHNFNYLSQTDWNGTTKCIDKTVANILEQILQEILKEDDNK